MGQTKNKPKHFNINTRLSKSHKNRQIKKKNSKPPQTLAKDHKNLKKTPNPKNCNFRAWLWTKPAGNVHLPAVPFFLRVGMLSLIQHIFLNFSQ